MLAPGLGFCEGVTRGKSEVGLGVVGLSNFELSHKRVQGEVIPPLFGVLSLLSQRVPVLSLSHPVNVRRLVRLACVRVWRAREWVSRFVGCVGLAVRQPLQC